MAIAFDTTTQNTGGSGTSLTFSHTNTGSDLWMHVLVRSDGTSSGATYAGVAMTLLAQGNDGTGNWYAEYYLANPASGANNFVVSYGASRGYIQAFIASYTGVDSSSPEATNSSIGVTVGTSASIAVTTITANAWVIGSAGEQGAGVTSAGSNTAIEGTGINAARTYRSTLSPIATPASTTMNFDSSSGSSDWSVFAYSLKPVGAVATSNAMFMGANF